MKIYFQNGESNYYLLMSKAFETEFRDVDLHFKMKRNRLVSKLKLNSCCDTRHE